jgi:hypothetical protein
MSRRNVGADGNIGGRLAHSDTLTWSGRLVGFFFVPITATAPYSQELIMHDTTLFDADSTFRFNDANWRRFPPKKHEELGLSGNELYGNRFAKAGALVCPASSRSEKIAVSQSGLNYLYDAVQRGGSITSGQVIFSGWDDKRHITYIIIKMDVIDAFNKVKDITPRQGKYGPFWLFYWDGTPEDDDDVLY